MWMLGRYVGAPRRCLECGLPKCSTRHFIECCGAENLDALCWAKRWAQALPLLQRILFRAEGLQSAFLQSLTIQGVRDDVGDTLRIYE